jgi:hypothetical protein
MVGAGESFASDVWSKIKIFAKPELHKIAVQIVEISKHLNEIHPETARELMDMQVRSALAVIVAMTELTLVAAQRAINAILGAIRDFVNAALPIPLIR